MLEVMGRLDARSLSRLACVCKDLDRVSGDWSLWRALYLADFGGAEPTLFDITRTQVRSHVPVG